MRPLAVHAFRCPYTPQETHTVIPPGSSTSQYRVPARNVWVNSLFMSPVNSTRWSSTAWRSWPPMRMWPGCRISWISSCSLFACRGPRMPDRRWVGRLYHFQSEAAGRNGTQHPTQKEVSLSSVLSFGLSERFTAVFWFCHRRTNLFHHTFTTALSIAPK